MLIDFPAVILSSAIFAYNSQRSIVIYSLIGGVSNVILDLILIPSFGIVGSACATLIAQFISNNYLWRKMKAINHFVIMPYLKNIIGATTGMALVSWLGMLIHVNVVINIFISASIYFGLLYKLKEPLLQEIKMILKTAKSGGSGPAL
jgi:O-antigen/teichoic acid export membrane protein